MEDIYDLSSRILLQRTSIACCYLHSFPFSIYSNKSMALLPQQALLLNGLENFYKEKVLCDITLQAEDVTTEAHKCVLAAGSPYFRYS